MRETDAFSWSMEADPRLRMTVVAVALLDGVPDQEELRTRMDRLTRAVPLFRQRVVETPGRIAPPKWVVDDRFDLDWHVHRVAAPAPGNHEAVLDLAARLGSGAFDLARPLWEVWLVDRLDGGGSAVVAKVHHTLTDGLGGMQLLAHLFDVGGEPLSSTQSPPVPPGGRTDLVPLVRGAVAHKSRQALAVSRGTLQAVGRTLAAARTSPREAGAGAVRTLASVLETVAPTGDKLSPVMVGRGLRRRYATLDVPLEPLRSAGRAVGGTVNDAFLAGITGGLRRYHALHDADVAELRVTLPVSTRQPDDATAGNRIALLRFQLPVGTEDPAVRLAETSRRTRRWKDAPGLDYTELVYGLVNWLPTSYLQGLATHVDLVASNVPGFPVPVRLAGPSLDALYAFGPTGGTALNVTMMSYAGTVNVGIDVDADAVPDVDALLTCLRAGFDEVLALAPGAVARAQVSPSAVPTG